MDRNQKNQVRGQWLNQQHSDFVADVILSSKGDRLKNFNIHKGVWNPVITTSIHMAKYLFSTPEFYKDKCVIDIGSGTGLLGIVMMMNGAQRVLLTDISLLALKNMAKNIVFYGLQDKARILEADLFDGVKMKADLIVFNHPFYAGKPTLRDPISTSMLDSGDLINRFLQQAPNFLTNNGKILMPFFTKASYENNPFLRGPEWGYQVRIVHQTLSNSGLQKGKVIVCELFK